MLLPDHKLKFFASYIEKELGIVYSEHNFFQLQNRLEEIVKILNFKDLDELWDKSQVSITGDLKQLLLDIATNNETSFFRDPKIFKAVESFVLPEWQKKNSKAPLKTWSAASSFGQEVYTLSMTFNEWQKKFPNFTWQIFASDIADRALKRAQEGRYSQLEIQRGLPAPLLIKYFSKDTDNYWKVKPELKNNVSFKKQNLLDPFSTIGNFDLIFCRNVLIYQRVENKAKVIEKMAQVLNPGGILVMGAGESLIGISDKFEQVHTDGVVFYRVKALSALKAA